MRFDSPEQLETWVKTGRWPAIHDRIADFATQHVFGRRLIDLGCSYGLLGARIMAQAGMDAALGIDSDQKAISAAQKAGVPILFKRMQVTGANLDALGDVIAEMHADVLVARRVLPELFGDDLAGGWNFGRVLHEAGIREIVVQGRVDGAGSVNPLRSVRQEVELLSHSYREGVGAGPLSYLTAR